MNCSTDKRDLIDVLGGEEVDLTEWTYVMPCVDATDIYAKGGERLLVDRKTGKAIIKYNFISRR